MASLRPAALHLRPAARCASRATRSTCLLATFTNHARLKTAPTPTRPLFPRALHKRHNSTLAITATTSSYSPHGATETAADGSGPFLSEPDSSGSLDSEPDGSGSFVSEPDSSGPFVPEPDSSGPLASEPDSPGPFVSEPDSSGPLVSEPASSEPDRSQSRISPAAPAYHLTFTCKPCWHRSTHLITQHGYHNGTVLITCPGCQSKHVISDHLHIFSDTAVTVESILQEKGELVKRGRLGPDGEVEFWDDGS
ncbi:MAG: hypothetical protein M1816_007201 [Peltula sp. TS41687]|nr:MAG: hypothetical protein M1816_007201 [Peltula sp. TS41687]